MVRSLRPLRQNGPRSRQAKRKFITYAELSSSEDEYDCPSKQSRRSARQRPNYYESSSDRTSTDSENISSSSNYLNAASSPTSRAPLVHTQSRRNRRRLSNINPATSETKTNTSKRSKRNKLPVKSTSPLHLAPFGGTHVPWQTLSYEILTQIFHFASHPHFDRLSRRPTSSIEWLLNASTVCKSFHEAAVSVLLFSPPLIPSHRAHDLLARLKQNNNKLTVNYEAKIRKLEIEVKQLTKKHGVNLAELIQSTPQLKHLAIYSALDQISVIAHPSSARTKWSYPNELFDTLDESIRLRSFEFNGRFPDTENVVNTLSAVSNRPAFRNLQSLGLLNLAEGDQLHRDLVIQSLSALTSLNKLVLRRCSILNGEMLSKLPLCLSHLSLTYCNNVRSSDLEAYLEIGGGALSSLQLENCQNLDFAFSSTLAQTCPHLVVLRVDCTHCDSALRDVQPHFNDLVPFGYYPTWPKTLQVVELVQLRRLSMETTETLLESLISAGPSLKHLRALSLKLILKVGWRERSALRRTYTTKLEDMFLRRASSPTQSQVRQTLPSPETSRPSSRHSDSLSCSFTGAKLSLATRKSARVARQRNDNAISSGSGSEAQEHVRPSSEDGRPLTGRDEVQGMCSTVRLQVDDQRPSDYIYSEADFVYKGDDDEEADEEEWTG